MSSITPESPTTEQIAAIRETWATALESGAYRRTTDQLRYRPDPADLDPEQIPTNDYGYCCLGVLCDVINPDGWNGDSFDRETTMPPAWVAKQAGFLSHPDKDDEYENLLIAALATHNDQGTLDFPAIAAFIRTLGDDSETAEGDAAFTRRLQDFYDAERSAARTDTP